MSSKITMLAVFGGDDFEVVFRRVKNVKMSVSSRRNTVFQGSRVLKKRPKIEPEIRQNQPK